jgi:hypothetical protein
MTVRFQPAEINGRVLANRLVRSAIQKPGPANRCESGDRRTAPCKPDDQCFGLPLKCRGGRCVTAERERQV